MQLAAATATTGTNRPTNGFIFCIVKRNCVKLCSIIMKSYWCHTFVSRFNPRAVVKAPPVAITYDVNSWL